MTFANLKNFVNGIHSRSVKLLLMENLLCYSPTFATLSE